MKGYILRNSNYDDLERAKLATAESGRCWGVWGARRGARRQPGASGGCGGAPGSSPARRALRAQAPWNVQQRERPVRQTLDGVVTTCLAGSRTMTMLRSGEQVAMGRLRP